MTQHAAAHDLALLEAFVHDGVQRLPRLARARPHELPRRCATYHTSCAALLREVLGALGPQAPRLGHLTAQVWELTSLNVFVLVQLAQTALGERDAHAARARHLEQLLAETGAQHQHRAQRHETEAETTRAAARELRAELQKTRQKHNRVAVENAQLRRALHSVMETTHDMLSTTAAVTLGATTGGSSPAEDDHAGGGGRGGGEGDDDIDARAMGNAEEWELYGVQGEDLERLETVHPLESRARDFDRLCQSLVDKGREQVAVLNDLDRFMSSNVVALLWRHGPDVDESRFLQRMMNARTVGTQTDDAELGILPDDDGFFGDGDADADGDGNGDGGEDDNAAARVTTRRVIPPALRAQLTTRPKIKRVLEKDQLARALLHVLVDKLECDGRQLRQQQPRLGLHRFLKEHFVERFGLVPLAEFHLLELVKSCLFYHERREAERRQAALAAATAVATATTSGSIIATTRSSISAAAVAATGRGRGEGGGATATTAGSASLGWRLLPGEDLPTLGPDDARIGLFARLSELVPVLWRAEGGGGRGVVGGNLFATALNAVVDLLGDLIELDPALSSVRAVLDHELAAPDRWRCPVDLARVLLGHHLAFLPAARLAETRGRELEELADGAGRVPVDVLLVLFCGAWLDHDQRLSTQLHEGFQRATAGGVGAGVAGGGGSRSASVVGRLPSSSSVGPGAPPLELLRRIWTALPNSPLSVRDLEELDAAFRAILAVRQTQQGALVGGGGGGTGGTGGGGRRASVKRPSLLLPLTAASSPLTSASSAVAVTIGGITAKEFVFQTQQLLRARRVCRGLRTHGRAVFDHATGRHFGGHGRVLPDDDEATQLPIGTLKPGLG